MYAPDADPAGLDAIETTVMRMSLTGDLPLLAILREQYRAAEVVARRYTGFGFFTKFSVPAHVPRAEGVAYGVIGDVYADIEEVEGGVCFLVFLKDGAIDILEGASALQYADTPKLVRAYYMCPVSGTSGTLRETAVRDWGFAIEISSTLPRQRKP